MKPPICDYCNQRFELSGENAGGLVSFKPTAEDKKQLARFKRPGFVGHPPNQEWFCHDHIQLASSLSHLSLAEALKTMRKELG